MPFESSFHTDDNKREKGHSRITTLTIQQSNILISRLYFLAVNLQAHSDHGDLSHVYYLSPLLSSSDHYEMNQTARSWSGVQSSLDVQCVNAHPADLSSDNHSCLHTTGLMFTFSFSMHLVAALRL